MGSNWSESLSETTWQTATAGDVLSEVLGFLGFVWIAFLVGVGIGWAWKPRWAGVLRRDKLGCVSVSKTMDSPSTSSPSGSVSSPVKGFGVGSLFRLSSFKLQQPKNSGTWVLENGAVKEPPMRTEEPLTALEEPPPPADNITKSISKFTKEESFIVPEKDLMHFYELVELKDGGPTWMKIMDRSTPCIDYQAWRRDPKTGPPQYRSRTVFEDVTPELVRDFFWDDEFRSSWDDMLIHSETIEECTSTGSMVVRWVRKFPFFCSDREYIIGRRIWESENSFYCVTKGVPCPSIPRCKRPRRVDLYYSSWCIRPVESRTTIDQPKACEVLLFHHEDMGIPWEIAKLAVQQGMWGAVKKIEPGLHAYQKARASGMPLSQSASMAQINTKINPEDLRSFGSENALSETRKVGASDNPLHGSNIPKLLIVGGAVLLACSLDHGLLTKTVIFGVARRFSNIGKRLQMR